MRGLVDVLSNWLSIKLVFEVRPFDHAAKKTLELFEEMISEEYQCKVDSLQLEGHYYIVHVIEKGKSNSYRFPKEYAEIMLNQIERQPEKYSNISP